MDCKAIISLIVESLVNSSDKYVFSEFADLLKKHFMMSRKSYDVKETWAFGNLFLDWNH